MKFSDKILSVFLPHKCTFCREVIDYTNNSFICPSCIKSLPFIKGETCFKCGTPRIDGSMPVCHACRKYKHPFSKAFTPLVYMGSVRKSILGFKFYNKENFCRSFSFLITNRIIEEGFPDFDFITYIPLSREGFKQRGFNQSELIARKCGEILNIPVIETLLRIDGTPRQSSLSLSQRRKNAKNAFKSKNMKLNGTALLIDDVYTTGSTLSHTSSLLLKMGCDKVYIAAVALRDKN